MIRPEAIALWEKLRREGLAEGAPPEGSATATPWYVRTMLGIAGWIGAMFLLGFVGSGFAFIINSASAALVVGVLLCAVAFFLYRARPDGDFFSQFALALSLAGQFLLVTAFSQFFGHDSTAGPALVLALVQAGLFLLMPNFLHRVWSAAAGALALVVGLDSLGFEAYTQALILAAFAWTWLNEFTYPARAAQFRALGYGWALFLIGDLVVGSMTRGESIWSFYDQVATIGGELGVRIGAALTGVVAIWVVWKLLARHGLGFAKGPGPAALASVLLVGLLSIKAPGIAVTLVILLVGFAHGNLVLRGLGIIGLLAYLSYYYYSLQITLLEKSAWLACAGIVLLIARFALGRMKPAEGAPHA